MIKIVVLENQTLADISVRYCGTMAAIVDIAFLNNISITDDLTPGQLVLIPDADYGFKEVVDYFDVNNIQPATALSEAHTALLDSESGIGFWELGNNFIVQ